MEQNQITEQEIAHVLEVVKKIGYVNWTVCNKELLSPAKATLMLKMLHQQGIISSEENGDININFQLLEEHLNKKGDIKMKTDKRDSVVAEEENIPISTIKAMGMEKIIMCQEFSAPNLQISRLLTSDLTAEEILESLVVIHNLYGPLNEFLKKYEGLTEKLKGQEEECKKIAEESKNLKTGTGFIPGIVFWVGLGVALVLKEKQLLQIQIVLPFCILLGIGCLIWYLGAKSNATQKANNLVKEAKNRIEPEINALKHQIENLPATNILKNATFGVSKLSALIIAQRLISLGDILKKIAVIVDDKNSTPSNRLVAMENYLYLLKKQEMDEQLLDETKRANELAEERIKAIKDMENAVNLQTEYQIWQDRGYELGKISAASRLYEKK